jgi:hypothetical protein
VLQHRQLVVVPLHVLQELDQLVVVVPRQFAVLSQLHHLVAEVGPLNQQRVERHRLDKLVPEDHGFILIEHTS